MKSDGSFTASTDIKEYVRHLASLSHAHFHTELFMLIMYNMLAKQNMVKSASLHMRNKTNAQNVACNLTNEEVTNAVHAIGNGTVHARSQTNGDSIYDLLMLLLDQLDIQMKLLKVTKINLRLFSIILACQAFS